MSWNFLPRPASSTPFLLSFPLPFLLLLVVVSPLFLAVNIPLFPFLSLPARPLFPSISHLSPGGGAPVLAASRLPQLVHR